MSTENKMVEFGRLFNLPWKCCLCEKWLENRQMRTLHISVLRARASERQTPLKGL